MSDTASSLGPEGDGQSDTLPSELGGALGMPVPDREAGRYGIAIKQMFTSDRVVREALRTQLGELTQQSLQIQTAAEEALSKFTLSRFSAADREQPTYFTAGENLADVLDDVVDRGVEAQRALPEPGRLRLRLTPSLMELIDTAGATDDKVGTIKLADLIKLGRTSAPLPPGDPVAPCRAEAKADELLDAIDGPPAAPPPVAQSQFVDFKASVAGDYPAHDTQHDYLVADKKEKNWPDVATWQVTVPNWAVECDAELQVINAQIVDGDVYGKMWLDFGGTPTPPQTYAIEYVAEAARHVVPYGVTFTVPADLRGKVITVRSRFQSYYPAPGRLDAKGGTTTKLALNFQRSPDVPAPAPVDVADRGNGAGPGGAVSRSAAGRPDERDVGSKVDELLESMRTPESALIFDVPRRADQETLRGEIATFELRSGPADVTSYHDFTSLRIAFERVWTEVFDGRLATLGRQLYEESVKLKEFAGVDPTDVTIDTLDDLKRLMIEVRDLAEITADNVPREVRTPIATGAVAGVSQGTTAVDIAKKVLLGGPTGDKTVDGILNPGGALINAIGNVFAGKARLSWEDFPGPLPISGDVIEVTFEPDAVDPGIVEIVIDNGPEAWWWKGIEFREFDAAGTVVANFRISNDPNDSGVWDKASYNRLPLYTPQLANGLLELQKAAFLGVHTGFYVLAKLPDRIIDRTRVTFRWEQDS